MAAFVDSFLVPTYGHTGFAIWNNGIQWNASVDAETLIKIRFSSGNEIKIEIVFWRSIVWYNVFTYNQYTFVTLWIPRCLLSLILSCDTYLVQFLLHTVDILVSYGAHNCTMYKKDIASIWWHWLNWQNVNNNSPLVPSMQTVLLL